jgi:hypothetical protein
MLLLLDLYHWFCLCLEVRCQSSRVKSSLASLPHFLTKMICRDMVVWSYFLLTIWFVTSVKACPVTFTNLKHCFIPFDIPSEKQWSSSRTYSLKVSPLHQPIFWICISENPFKARAHAPLICNECVLILSIGIPQLLRVL